MGIEQVSNQSDLSGVDPSAALEELRRHLDGGSYEVPVLPDVATRLLAVSSDEEWEPQELAELIRRDQSITSNLLRYANSPRYSGGGQVISVQKAVAQLGMKQVKELVVLASCERIFDVPGFEDVIQFSFQRSLASAAFAQEIAQVSRGNVELAFLCGLLHDIGMPVVLQALVDTCNRRGKIDRDEVLEVAYNFRYAVSCDLISSWRLPSDVAEAVGEMGYFSDCEDKGLANTLQLAIYLAELCLSDADLDVEEILQHEVVSELNFNRSDVEQFVDSFPQVRELVDETSQ